MVDLPTLSRPEDDGGVESGVDLGLVENGEREAVGEAEEDGDGEKISSDAMSCSGLEVDAPMLTERSTISSLLVAMKSPLFPESKRRRSFVCTTARGVVGVVDYMCQTFPCKCGASRVLGPDSSFLRQVAARRSEKFPSVQSWHNGPLSQVYDPIGRAMIFWRGWCFDLVEPAEH